MGPAWLSGSLPLLTLTLLSSYLTAGQQPCTRSVRANGTRTARTGTRVVIDCGLEGAEWRFNGKRLSPSRWRGLNTTALVLNATQRKDTGNYACLSNGTAKLRFHLVVEEVPRMPAPSCVVKSYLSPIRCEWSSPELGKWTKCLLSYRLSYQEKLAMKPCKFYTGKKVCVCMLVHKEGEHERYYIGLTVYNTVGCTVGPEKTFNFENLLQPDPPEWVRVRPVQGAPRKLNVSWSYPGTWRAGYYNLIFQLHYQLRDHHQHSQEVEAKETTFLIADAFADRNYTVRVRAMEEFQHGSWSQWSRAAYGQPWADPKKNMISDDDREGLSSGTIDPDDVNTDVSTAQSSHLPLSGNFPWYGPLLVAVSLFIVLSLFILILIRYRRKWKGHSSAKSKGASRPEYLPVPLVQASEPKEPQPPAETSLQSDPGPPSPQRGGEPPSQPQPPFDVINVSYFYIPS